MEPKQYHTREIILKNNGLFFDVNIFLNLCMVYLLSFFYEITFVDCD